MTSLRRRVVGSAVVIATLVLLGSGVLVFLLVRGELSAQADASLAAQARTMASLVEYDDERHRIEFTGDSLLAAEGDRLRMCIRTDDGRLVVSTTIPPPGGDTAAGDAWNWVADDGTRWRTVMVQARAQVEEGDRHVAAGIPVRVQIARPMHELDQRLRRLMWLLVVVTVVVVTVLALALAVVLRRSLTPLDGFAGALARLDDRTLHHRVVTSGVPAELAPVADHLNRLLARLDEAFARERTFSTAIAHELRTPVAGLLMQLDVALSRQRDPEMYRTTIEKAFGITQDLQRMIASLLLLGRLDRDQVPLTPVEHDLVEVVGDAIDLLQARAVARQVRWQRPTVASFRVESDPDLLGRIIANLLENAVAYADLGGEVTVALAARGSGWSLTVTNPCAGFDPQNLSRVFERFWRGDAARSESGQHCGLGLALCREIAGRLGMTVTVAFTQGRFIATVMAASGFRSQADT
jgi:heavy metal sensor kinase